jgi:hypothetical protein
MLNNYNYHRGLYNKYKTIDLRHSIVTYLSYIRYNSKVLRTGHTLTVSHQLHLQSHTYQQITTCPIYHTLAHFTKHLLLLLVEIAFMSIFSQFLH